MALSAHAKQDAESWGQYRAQELIREMQALAGDHAAENDADRGEYLAAALKAASQTLYRDRPKQR